uniref:Uncharacterized protein n=1 Tax=Arundo donax TaxID=35708 RepID=A0A0A8YB10_ARUDO
MNTVFLSFFTRNTVCLAYSRLSHNV